MIEAKIIQINRQQTRIFVRFVILGEDDERVLIFHKSATADDIRDRIRIIVAELNEAEENARLLEQELKDEVITL